ncbi:afadin-like isoform X3 [Daphnia pulex]|uniref:afadin-like isoform X3 n=1 Tax=Daphnia pulex TaxID=6669 RepID=UPI001EDF8785|nr:afadin-like isoform X3 [Daphnia pulex]
MPAMMEFEDRKWRDREALKHIIGQWNANRLDLFSLSEPNEEFEFHGVMRFYFQDAGQKIATKCIRVSSTGSTQAVIETLIEKFRPDMKMLHMTEYALYEIHPNEERCLGVDEKPLLVQLNWHKDDREGRFLLRRADEKSTLPAQQPPEESSFRRKLSKREKRNAKKENKLRKLKSSDNDGGGGQDGENGGKNGTVAEKLYTELPETSFTRSISNPEAVMRRRRQQKLERKLQLFRSKDGGPDTGGTLKIYGESLCRDVPYKTLLLSVRETAAYVVREMLDKYALTREDPTNYCLVQVTGSPPNQQQTGNNNSEPPSEYILEDDECPLSILMNHTPGSGPVMFHVRRRPADSNSQAARRRKKKLSGSGGSQGGGGNANANSCGSGGGSVHRLTGVGDLSSPDQDPEQRTLPYLVELNPDGSEVRQGNQIRRHFVSPTVTEVGSERPAPPHPSSPISVPSIQLFGPGIHPRHCVLAHTEGMVTLTPCSPQAETYVNGQRLCETTLLQHGCVIRFGRNAYQFRFIDPASEFRTPAASTALNYERFTGQPGGANRAVSTTPSASNLIPSVSASAAAAAIVAPPPPPAGPVVVPGTDPILPAVLELPEDVEDAFLHSLIPNLDTRQIVFRLAPTYSLYLMARYRASTHFRPELNPMERAQRLTLTLSRVGAMMQAIVQERYADPPSLAFWMANASELLHFLKSDRHICAFSLDGQDLLAEAVQIAFRNASVCLTAELLQSMPPMLSPPTSQQLAEGQPEQPEEEAATAQVLSVLSSTMGLLRRCRVNAALTIQLFSQLFHALNAALFNRLVGLDSPRLPASASHHLLPPPGANLCSRQWGLALSRRLRRLEAWAERQGLELAADCHLARVMQAAHLLQSPKNTAEQLVETASSCFKLNSLQLRALLERYRPSPQDGEPANAIPAQLIQHIVRVAEGTADELQLADGRPLRLDEDSQLAVPFLLPDDGYSCDVMRGIPTGLMEVLGPLQQAGLCRLTPQPTSSGLWTIYMGEGSTPVVAPQPQQHPIRAPSVAGEAQAYAPQQQQQQQPELQLLQLRKASDSMGLSIVAARGTGQQQLGIYIKSVVKGGSADIDGRLQAGDQLLSVDGYSLVGITQDRAAEILMRTSHTVRLEVAKQAAMFHGLATLLSQPSPTSTVSRSTLSLNKMDPVQQQQQRRPPLPQTQQQQQQQQQQAFQERLVDWDRPPTSHRMNSNSSPSLANINDPQQQQQAMGQGRPLQQMAPQLRNANSRSVPALHHNSEPNVGMNQSQDGIHHFQTEQQQQQFYAQQQQQQQQRAMMNQRAMSAQLLSQPRYPNPPQQSTEPTSPTRSTAQQQLQQQQQQATRSRSVQNLSAETQQQQQTRASTTTLRARHPSDERQYQNIALYQQQQQQQQQHMQYPGGQGPRPQYAQQLPLPPPPPQQQQQQQPRGLLSPVSRTAPGAPAVPASVAHLRQPSMAQQQQSSDSPPPPPPPPVSTHPLVAAAAATGQQQQQQSPWEREEKERETAMRRQEAARQWMEEQIEELESLGLGNRTPKQEEQLRALRLEMEFRKRAMEAAEEEDDDDGEASGDRRGMLRLVQEDLERARQWRLEKQQQVQQPMPPPQQQQQPPMTNGTNNNNTATVPDQERMRKIEAFQRKQRELEATQAAEERIIREAQRRKEEDIHRHQQMQQHQQQQQQQQWRPTPGANIPIPPPSAMSGGQRLDGVIHQSSSMEMAQHVSSSTSTSSATTSTTTKRVSFFQETTQSSDNKTPTREDPDAFILEAENMLANTPPKTSGSGVMGGGGGGSSSIDQLLLTGVSTPGVIGSQEVYRDPRLKRLAEQQQQQKTQLKPGPEKLTFQEKMKMFALESGEQATPKDKSKISKAQREIELKPSPMSEKNSN